MLSRIGCTLIVLLMLIATPIFPQHRGNPIRVTPIGLSGLDSLIHQRNGKILFLNIWATWCQPCVEEFPDIVKIHKRFADSLVDVAAISVDYPDEINSKILPFLISHKVHFPVFVSNVKKEDDFMDALNPSWRGAVPVTFIFDKKGTRRVFLFGEQNFGTFSAKVDSVLRMR